MSRENPTAGGKEIYAALGVSHIPRILALVDRNPLSPTYGCFDKSYWHYKTSDFPSGMYQECVLPLSLVYKYPIPGGERYHMSPRLRELVIAGIKYARSSSHRDGSADDYYPFERALGATCFSLYGCTEAYLELGIEDPETVEFFLKRGRWLMNRQESGRLSNHQALAACCLENVYLITGEEEFHRCAGQRAGLVLGWQHDEGWFQEYEGADPGYQTITINFLAKYYRKSGDESLLGPLRRAIEFSSYFVHPDGSYGGEYGSRNTMNFFPNGYEILGNIHPKATWIADNFIRGFKTGTRAWMEDERIFFHFTGNYLEAFLNYHREPRRREPEPERNFTKHFPAAGLYARRGECGYSVLSLAKGGVIKHYARGGHALTDTGITGRLRDGGQVVTHLVDHYDAEVTSDRVSIAGRFSYCSPKVATPLKMIAFRIVLLTLGRFLPNLVRKILQKMLITGKKQAPIGFRRTFCFGDDLRIVDEIEYLDSNGQNRFTELYAGIDQTSIYVAMSNQYQESHLTSWEELSRYLGELNDSGYVRIERVIGDISK